MSVSRLFGVPRHSPSRPGKQAGNSGVGTGHLGDPKIQNGHEKGPRSSVCDENHRILQHFAKLSYFWRRRLPKLRFSTFSSHFRVSQTPKKGHEQGLQSSVCDKNQCILQHFAKLSFFLPEKKEFPGTLPSNSDENLFPPGVPKEMCPHFLPKSCHPAEFPGTLHSLFDQTLLSPKTFTTSLPRGPPKQKLLCFKQTRNRHVTTAGYDLEVF